MAGPIDPNYRNIYDERPIEGINREAPEKPFNIHPTQKSDRTKKDLNKQKKRDKDGKEIDEEEDDENKPLPRPMGL